MISIMNQTKVGVARKIIFWEALLTQRVGRSRVRVASALAELKTPRYGVRSTCKLHHVLYM